jgi:uncharacterized protein related to proFAR isomerase
MEAIPVIDVRYGVAVRAVAGDRANYKPLITPLAAGSDPLAIAAGLLALHPFPALYVADLDGIEGRGANLGLIAAFRHAFPGVGLWIDNGAYFPDEIDAILTVPSTWAVLGTEMGGWHPDDLAKEVERTGGRLALSFDFRTECDGVSRELLESPWTWPDAVIVMTLARVGSTSGPDFTRVADIARRSTRSRVYAAGGVRNQEDMARLAGIGAYGALISTALHAKTITAGDLVEVPAVGSS